MISLLQQIFSLRKKYFPESVFIPVRVDTEPDEEVYDDVQDINHVKDGRNGMQKSKGRRVCRHLNKSVKV